MKSKLITLLLSAQLLSAMQQMPFPLIQNISEYVGVSGKAATTCSWMRDGSKANDEARKAIDQIFAECSEKIPTEITKEMLPGIVESLNRFTIERMQKIILDFDSVSYDQLRKKIVDTALSGPSCYGDTRSNNNTPVDLLILRCMDDSSLFKNIEDTCNFYQRIIYFYPSCRIVIDRSMVIQIQHQSKISQSNISLGCFYGLIKMFVNRPYLKARHTLVDGRIADSHYITNY